MSNQPSRSSQRQSRRAERRAAQERQARRQRLLLVGGAVALALIVGLGLILLPNLTGGGSSASNSNIQIAEGAPTGVPTSDRTMGDPNAPVTVVEWGDYQ